MPIAELADININYEIHGSGPRLLMISGTGGDLRHDPNRAHGFLPRHFEVLMFDQRGLGQTSKPDKPYTMADYADDAARLMDFVGWQSAHTVGISFGGMVAQHFALRHPDKVDQLVLMCTSSGGAGGDSFDLLALHDMEESERLKITASVMDTRNDLSVDPPKWAPWCELIFSPNSARPNFGGEAKDLMGARRQLEARAAHNTWDKLGNIKARTLVCGGTYDMQAPPENVAKLAGAIPGAQLQMFDGGHLFMLQDPTTWPAVTEFLTA